MVKESLENYIYINKFYLTLIGLWPNEKSDSLWRTYIHKFHSLLFASLLWTLLLLPMLLDIYIVWGNNYALFQNISMTVHGVSVCLKFTHIATNQTTFKVLV